MAELTFKMRFRAWTGKHISKLYDEFNLKRNSAISKIDKKTRSKKKRQINLKRKELPGFNDDKAIGGINGKSYKTNKRS